MINPDRTVWVETASCAKLRVDGHSDKEHCFKLGTALQETIEEVMAEPKNFDPFVSTEEVEIEPEELAIIEERDTDDESQFISAKEARQRFHQWLSKSSTKPERYPSLFITGWMKSVNPSASCI